MIFMQWATANSLPTVGQPELIDVCLEKIGVIQAATLLNLNGMTLLPLGGGGLGFLC
jgi:hypothetical protein